MVCLIELTHRSSQQVITTRKCRVFRNSEHFILSSTQSLSLITSSMQGSLKYMPFMYIIFIMTCSEPMLKLRSRKIRTSINHASLVSSQSLVKTAFYIPPPQVSFPLTQTPYHQIRGDIIHVNMQSIRAITIQVCGRQRVDNSTIYMLTSTRPSLPGPPLARVGRR